MNDRRALTPGEVALARTMFGEAIDYAAVTVRCRKWIFFQPRDTVMAPRGHIHCHPKGSTWRADYAAGSIADQGLFIHEMTHVWQHQSGIFLPIARHPFCRYRYTLVPGRGFAGYGIEQQAEIVRHAWMQRLGLTVPDKPGRDVYDALLPFSPPPAG
jgi:hypothetical protein